MNTMAEHHNLRDQALLDRAAQALRDTVGWALEVDELEPLGADAKVHFRGTNGACHGPWYVEIKRTLQQRPLAALVAKLKHNPDPILLVTEYANPRQAEILRDLRQPFLDAAGNIYVEQDDLFLYVTGRRKLDGHDPHRARRAFRPTELKLILLFLCDAEALNAPYRELAERAGIALGNVAQAIKALEAQHYLVRQTRRDRRLTNRRELLDRWVTDYIARLRPAITLGRYQGRKPAWWRAAKLTPKQAQWGGEVAAAHWTRYLKPGTATLYVAGNPAKLLAKHGLARDRDGDTEILTRFWPADLDDDARYVPRVIAYADLLAIGGARTMEAATELFEAELAADFPQS